MEGESPRGPMAVDEALAIAMQIADAMSEAHQKGIVHRDLKAGNIKITPAGTVKVLDFGLAKALDIEPGGVKTGPDLTQSPTMTSPAMMTHAGMILGTAAYMAPEQARGKRVDARADIWAFGVVLYELLTGKRPFAGDDLTDTLASVVKDRCGCRFRSRMARRSPFLELSPDGTRVLLRLNTGDTSAIYIRSLDANNLQLLTGSENARSPFWSYDGRFIAFFANNSLRVIPSGGGPVRVLCGEAGVGRGGKWNRDGVILFASETGALRRVDVALPTRAALDGVGLTFMSDEQARPHLKSGALVRVLEDWCPPFPGFFLYYPSRKQQPGALAALIERLRIKERDRGERRAAPSPEDAIVS